MSMKTKVIQHWEENLTKARNRQLPDIRMRNCAYCREYYDPSPLRSCKGCPILIATGQTLCDGTPYYRVSELRNEIFLYDEVANQPAAWSDLIKAVEAELEFLRSLPEDQEET